MLFQVLFMPNVLQIPLPKLISDYMLVILYGNRRRRPHAHFLFENMWLKATNFNDRVKDWWTGYEVSVKPY